MRTTFSVAERIAIAECVFLAELCASSSLEAVKTIGGLAAERAANIIRGETDPNGLDWTNADVARFAKVWRVHERASFNPLPKRKGRNAARGRSRS